MRSNVRRLGCSAGKLSVASMWEESGQLVYNLPLQTASTDQLPQKDRLHYIAPQQWPHSTGLQQAQGLLIGLCWYRLPK